MSYQPSRQQQQQQQQVPGSIHHSMGPMSEAKEEMMWSCPDSGFTSQIPSVTGVRTPALSVYDDDGPAINYEWDGQIYTPHQQHQQQDDNIRGQQQQQQQPQPSQPSQGPPSVRGPIYPEAMDETGGPEHFPNLLQHESIEPSQMLQHAVNNLFNYPDNEDLRTKALPDLIQLLQDDDHVVVEQAAMMVHQLSKNETSRYAIISYPAMIETLIQTINQNQHPEIIKSSAGVLHNLSQDKQGLMAIFQAKGIHTLLRLLSSQVESVLFYAITTLHNLLLHHDESRNIVRGTDGLQRMVALLARDNVKFLAIVTDCLQLLTFGDNGAKEKLLNCHGPAELVRIMTQYPNYEKLLWTTSRVLKVLSVCQKNKPAIVQVGGMMALSMHLNHLSERLVLNCLWTIRNLSDCAIKYETVDRHLVESLIKLLSSDNIHMETCAAGILSNLTCNHQKNKSIIRECRGVEALVKTISKFGQREEILEPAVCALRHLTSRYPSTEYALSPDCLEGLSVVVVRLLNQPNRWPLIKAIIGLIRNLALWNSNHLKLREEGSIPRLVELLNMAFQKSQQCPIQDGVKMVDIIEGTVGALYTLAKDHENRKMIRQLNVVPVFVRLLYSNSMNVQSVTVGVLFELTADKDGIDLIESAGAKQALHNLQASSNNGIASYATKVLYAISSQNNHNNNWDVFSGGGGVGVCGSGSGISTTNTMLPISGGTLYGPEQGQWTGNTGQIDINDITMQWDNSFI